MHLPPRREPSAASAYLVAVVTIAAAMVARLALDPVLGAERPYLTSFGAVAIAVWYGRWRPATAAAILGFFAANWLIVEPQTGVLLSRILAIDAAGYVLSTGLIIGLGEAMHRARDRADQRREVLRITLASIGDGVITTDAQTRITFLNAVAEQLTGWPMSEAMGRPLETVFRVVTEESRAPLENPAARAVRDGNIVGLANHAILIQKDGTERPIDDSAAPIRNSDGQIIGCVLVFRDITGRRSVERERREADLRKDEFMATLAHELRNPLAPIRNAVQVLLHRGTPDPELRWCREVIDRQVQHMARLLDDLFDVSRIAHGKMALRTEPVDLTAILQGAIETSRPLFERRSTELAVTLPDQPLSLNGDAVRLAQVFTNLLLNAAKFTPSGGHVRLRCERQGTDAVVSVADNGDGIAPEHLPHIFDTFSQATRVLERSDEGLGIGLSLARGLVELHGGTVAAHSDGLGRGSEFVVRLPVVESPALSPGARADPKPSTRARRRLLIADDLRDSADSLALLMELQEHEVATAYDGHSALAAAREYQPEVALLDIGMPKCNGYDTCREIRRQPWGKAIHLIALTGWGQEEDRRRAKEAGFDHHLLKPVDPEELLAYLESLGR